MEFSTTDVPGNNVGMIESITKDDFLDSTVTEKISEQVRETREEFIFEAIRPYCEKVVQMKISKRELKQALLKYYGKNDSEADCISREAVINAINQNCIWENEYNLTSSRIKKAVEDLPSVTPQEPCEDWHDVPSDEMTLEQARQAVKDLRKKLAEHLEQELCKDAISKKADNLCNSCTNVGCEFQSGIVRTKCAFYMPPHMQPDKCGNYIVRWIPVSERLPKDLEPVNITWINHDPEPYYNDIKDKPFTATGVYFNGQWYWWSTLCTDILAEYSHNYDDIIDDAIEVTAWMPLPEPYKAESEVEE